MLGSSGDRILLLHLVEFMGALESIGGGVRLKRPVAVTSWFLLMVVRGTRVNNIKHRMERRQGLQ